mmetsp:Transcript_8989/g.31823  ORF Transcript_8989/g.31823 Transcript_8989/m.31823 type:complete len:272 (-) Transcript_8989:1191-2006(-)
MVGLPPHRSTTTGYAAGFARPSLLHSSAWSGALPKAWRCCTTEALRPTTNASACVTSFGNMTCLWPLEWPKGLAVRHFPHRVRVQMRAAPPPPAVHPPERAGAVLSRGTRGSFTTCPMRGARSTYWSRRTAAVACRALVFASASRRTAGVSVSRRKTEARMRSVRTEPSCIIWSETGSAFSQTSSARFRCFGRGSTRASTTRSLSSTTAWQRLADSGSWRPLPTAFGSPWSRTTPLSRPTCRAAWSWTWVDMLWGTEECVSSGRVRCSRSP